MSDAEIERLRRERTPGDGGARVRLARALLRGGRAAEAYVEARAAGDAHELASEVRHEAFAALGRVVVLRVVGAWTGHGDGPPLPWRWDCTAEPEVTLGRSLELPFRIRHPAVPRRQARLHYEGGVAFVALDLGSANGVYVGGRRIQAARLAPLDQLCLSGAVFVELGLEGVPPAAPG